MIIESVLEALVTFMYFAGTYYLVSKMGERLGMWVASRPKKKNKK